MDRHLCARVHRQPGEKVPGNPQHSEILDQYRVRLQILQQAQYLRHLIQFPVLYQGVYCYMYPHMPQMGIPDRLFQLPAVKISGTRTGAESRITEIDRIRSGRVRPFQCRPVPRRSQIFHAQVLLCPQDEM